MTDLRQAKIQRLYQPVSWLFGIMTLMFVGTTVYAAWSSATITVVPKKVNLTATLTLTVSPTAPANSTDHLVGTVTISHPTTTINVTPKSDGPQTPAHATGTMTLVNTTAKVQPLAAGTRLQSASGIIVRTDKRVDVPAGGQIDVTVTADPLGTDGEVGPGKFTIVALWPGLQTKIFGQTSSALVGGLVNGAATLSLDTLTTASDQGLETIRQQVGTSRAGTLVALDPGAVTTTPSSTTPSASYAVTVSATATTITYSSERLNELVRTELLKQVIDGQVLTTTSEPTIALGDTVTQASATLVVTATGTSTIAPSNPLLTPSSWTRQTPGTIQRRLLDSGILEQVTVRTSPWWRSTTPDRAERITVVVKPPVVR